MAEVRGLFLLKGKSFFLLLPSTARRVSSNSWGLLSFLFFFTCNTEAVIEATIIVNCRCGNKTELNSVELLPTGSLAYST